MKAFALVNCCGIHDYCNNPISIFTKRTEKEINYFLLMKNNKLVSHETCTLFGHYCLQGCIQRVWRSPHLGRGVPHLLDLGLALNHFFIIFIIYSHYKLQKKATIKTLQTFLQGGAKTGFQNSSY